MKVLHEVTRRGDVNKFVIDHPNPVLLGKFIEGWCKGGDYYSVDCAFYPNFPVATLVLTAEELEA